MAVADLKAFVVHENETVVFRLDGDLDARTAALVRQWVDAALEAGGTNVVLDLRDVASVDVQAIDALAAAEAQAARAGARIELRSPSVSAFELLPMTRRPSADVDGDDAGLTGRAPLAGQRLVLGEDQDAPLGSVRDG